LATSDNILSILFAKRISTPKQYLLSLSAILIIAIFCYSLNKYLSFEVVAFILLVSLSIIAMFFDIFPVLAAAVFSALIWDYFFLIPQFNLRVGNMEDRILLSMYFIIALINAALTFKIRQIEKIAQKKEEKVQTIKLYNTMLNSLSHEFRTPLAAIIGATDNLLTKPSNISECNKEKLLTEISIAALRLNQQVGNLLNMSRLESGVIEAKKDWCDLNEVIADVTMRLKEPLQTHCLQIEIAENLPLFKLDYVFMEQIIYNLVLNSCEYTVENSTINISVSHTSDAVMVIVQDSGCGIPDIEKEKVFDKFYRLNKTKTTGTGLGLSLVKGFTEASKGTIYLSDSKLGGAKFLITIPVSEILPKNFSI